MTIELTAAVARLREYAGSHATHCPKPDVRAVLTALEAAQADARRYRWLRGGAPGHSERWSRWNLQRWDGSSWHSLERTALDAAIDAAMKGEGDA